MAIYQGKKVTLNKPRRIRKGEPGYGRKKKVVFVSDDGAVKKVMFGDPNMKNKKHIKKNKDAFRKRMKCKTAKDKTTARHHACNDW